MRQLTGLDAQFLAMETPSQYGHVGGLAILDPSTTESGTLELADIQRLIAEDSVHAFLYQPQWITVANKNIKGLWKDMPIFVNDIAALSWA